MISPMAFCCWGSCSLHIEDVDGRFTRAQTLDNVSVEVLIRQKTDGHVRFEPIFSRAACRRANSSGFDWLSGGKDRSSSRWPSAMYSLTVFSCSRY